MTGAYPIRDGLCAVCGRDLAEDARPGRRDEWANLLCARCDDAGWRIEGLHQADDVDDAGSADLGWAGPVLLVLVLVGAFLVGVNAEHLGLVGWWAP